MYQTFPFTRFARKTARAMGHPLAFLIAVGVILAWGMTGPFFGFSDTWQLVINTGTTIVTFLMVFLIQNTQNRDSEAMQLKLDEIIRASRGAHNALLDLEELSEEDLDRLKLTYETLARRARQSLQQGLLDTGTPDIKADPGQPLFSEGQSGPEGSASVLFDKDGKVVWSAAMGARRRAPRG